MRGFLINRNCDALDDRLLNPVSLYEYNRLIQASMVLSGNSNSPRDFPNCVTSCMYIFAYTVTFGHGLG